MSRPPRQRLVPAVRLLSVLALTAALVSPAWAQDDSSEQDKRIDENSEKIETLAEEVSSLRNALTVPFDAPLISRYGLGPAASKVYNRDHGLSIGGYGEVRYRRFEGDGDNGDDDEWDALRAVLYVGYKFNDRFVLNSEIEFEHGGEEVGVEFLTLDFMGWDELNGRAGLVLVPMGFVNEKHEPTTYYGAERPEVERKILPSTWRENGVGVFGRLFDRVEYRAYVINSFDGTNFTSDGLRDGRQNGSEALANDVAFVGRFDVDLCDGLDLGGSAFVGRTGQNQKNTGGFRAPDALTTIYEVHAQYQGHGAKVRGLFTQAFVDQAGALSRYNGVVAGDMDAIASKLQGGYVEAGYDVMPLFDAETKMSLSPFFRYEYYDTNADVSNDFARDKTKQVNLYVAGIDFKPISQLVIKLDYSRFDPDQGPGVNRIQASLGYVF